MPSEGADRGVVLLDGGRGGVGVGPGSCPVLSGTRNSGSSRMSGTVRITTLTAGWASRIVATARSRFASARGPTSRKAATGSGVFIALMKSLPPMKTTTRLTSPARNLRRHARVLAGRDQVVGRRVAAGPVVFEALVAGLAATGRAEAAEIQPPRRGEDLDPVAGRAPVGG